METYFSLMLEHPEATKVILGALGMFIAGLITTVFRLVRSGDIKQESAEIMVQSIIDATKSGAEPVTDKIKDNRNGASKSANKHLDKMIQYMLQSKFNRFAAAGKNLK